MSDRMRGIPFQKLLNWILTEYRREEAIFGLPAKSFFHDSGKKQTALHGEMAAVPLGPAAGPHTQLAQNLVCAYLAGGRFFELKTVQILDRLTFPKPCISAADEGYNTEWSTELSVDEAFAEYVKGWFLIHLLAKELFHTAERSFVFNMSVGYDLAGIQSGKVDRFIQGMKDASQTDIFRECKAVLKCETGRFQQVSGRDIDHISAAVCSSVSLSTMHGCAPAEIEAICAHLLAEKKLHTYVKLNPTLLGYRYVRNTLDAMGYAYIEIKEESFKRDLRFAEAVAMIERLQALAQKNGREFGVKLSNTLPVRITGGELPGEEMYMSGRPLYALTINLAYRLAAQFAGNLKISYSGGADHFNIAKIYETGITPVTVATTLLKPGGYTRLKKLAEKITAAPGRAPADIDLKQLKKIATESVAKTTYHKKSQAGGAGRPSAPLPLFDCRSACTNCASVCPNRANIRIEVESSDLRFQHQILHMDSMCNQCGNCTAFCPYRGEPYRHKLTLFLHEADFHDSPNSGFLLLEEKAETIVKIRVNGKTVVANLGGAATSALPAADPALPPALLAVINSVRQNYSYLL